MAKPSIIRWIRKFKHTSPVKKLLIILIFSVPSVLVIIATSAEVTSRPAFCPTCHYMEPFYESWQHSSHNKVSCIKCHFPPGLQGKIRGKMEGLVQVVNYLARSYLRRRPWAEIDDASCLQSGCHEKRLLNGKVIFHNVVFNHTTHLEELRRGKRLRCTSCHSQIVQGNHMVVTETTCFLCHFKQGGHITPKEYKKVSNCTTCHNWKEIPESERKKFRFDHANVVKNKIDCRKCHQNVVVGDGFVPKQNCYNCHFDNARLSKYDQPDLLHKIHITQNKIECIQCHLQIQHKITRLTSNMELKCESCHTGDHKEQLALFTGASIDGIESVKDPMYEAGMDCSSCHIYHKDMMGKASVTVAKAEVCETCHGKGYSDILKQWKEAADVKLRQLKPEIDRVARMVSGSRSDGKKDAEELVNKAKHAYYVVEVGKAVHNIKYSNFIIRVCYNYLQEALDKIGSRSTLQVKVANPKEIGKCYSCHAGIEDISRRIYGYIFSHNVHIVQQKLKCTTCHSNKKVHGQLIIDRNSCNSCHHDNNKAACKTCHQDEYEVFSGKIFNSGEPDIMFQNDVACADCHKPNGKVVKPSDDICMTCHDESYVNMAVNWKQEVRKKIIDIRSLITSLKKADKYNNDVRQIERKLEKLESGAAGGLHNHELTLSLLDQFTKQLDKIKNPI